MRGLGRRLPAPAALLLPSSSSTPALTYSTFSGRGDGRGRGRGFAPAPPPPPPPSEDQDPFPSVGHGRGRGAGAAPSGPQHPTPPFFPSFLSSPSLGRGRGRPQQPPSEIPGSTADPGPQKPIFFSRETAQFDDPDEAQGGARPQTLPPPPLPTLPGAGRGKTPSAPGPKPAETNRHARPRQPIGAPTSKPSVGPAPAAAGPKLSREEAVKQAIGVLSRGDSGGRGKGRGRGRGVAGRGGRGRGRGRDDDEFELYVGDNADGEKFVKRMGEEKMKMVEEAFEEISWRVLPSPAEDAYLDALHTNNLIEYEPEYLMEFDTNPDIDEKPPMSLEEVLQKVKPFLMAYEGIKNQEEWEEIIKELMERLPHMKELMDMYCGPDRVTAKQQMQELDRVAKTLPENIPSSVKRFTDRAVLSLQSNPGWGWDKKCQFMDKLVWEVSQHYK